MNVSINLLPADLRRQSVRRHVIRKWVPVLVITTTAIAFHLHREWKFCADLSSRIESTQPQLDIANARMAAVSIADERVAALQFEIETLRRLQPANDPLKVMQLVSGITSAFRDSLVIHGMDILNECSVTTGDFLPATLGAVTQGATQGAILTGSTATGDPADTGSLLTTVQLRGAAVSDLAIARLVSSLRAARRFETVDVRSSGPIRGTDVFTREFLIECSRKEPKG